MPVLSRIGNNIVTSTPYPMGIKKFGKAHKSIDKMYDTFVGKTPTITSFNDFADYLDAQNNFNYRSVKLLGMNLWAGANILQKNVGKHKIPRYLYHITTKENYSKMLKDGYINISQDCPRGKGLYMFEMQNMLKHYKDFDGNRDLGRLLRQVCDSETGAVLLKIPTSILEAGKLVVRGNSGTGKNGMNSYSKQLIGDSALASKIYKQRKVALEYIYPEKLSMNDVSLVGTSNYNFFENEINESTALKIWKQLTQNQPEQKGVVNHIFKGESL